MEAIASTASELPIALYGRVSKREQAEDGDALKRQLWQLNREGDRREGQKLEFVDVQSGRRDDRPEFMKLQKLIASKGVRCVVVSRIDRITRDVETNARLSKLFERTGVEVFELLLGRAIDWKNPHDWEYFVGCGVKAEGESRMLSARVKQTFEWLRVQRKPVGRVGWPYRRGADGFIEPHPDHWETAVRAIEILLDEGGTTTRAHIRLREELGIDRSHAWLTNWARSPLLRGHTPRDTRDERGFRKKKGDPIYIDENTHVSLFSEPRLVKQSAQKRLDRILEDSKRVKGAALKFRKYPLSGLVTCGRCGCVCHVKRASKSKYPDKVYTYLMCSARGNYRDCGGKYGSLQGHRGTVHTPYTDVDAAVLEKLRSRGCELIEASISAHEAHSAAPVESSAAKRLRGQIAKLEAMEDPDLKEAIARKQALLTKQLLEDSGEISRVSQESRDLLMQYAALPEFWSAANDKEKREIYLEFVESISVDRQNIEITLRV